MADTTARSGRTTVRITGLGELEAAVRAAVAASPEATLHAEVSGLLEGARRRWPVRTGRSRRGLDLGRSGTGTHARVVARNEVPYAGDVRLAGHPEPAWRELVERPVCEAADALEQATARELEIEIQRRLDRGA